MELGEKGFNIIKQFEGCKLKAYLCSAGIPTIGWGSTFYDNGEPVKIGDTITQEEADELFKTTLKNYTECVEKHIKVNLTQNQFDALVSLCYNIGCGNFGRSSVKSKVNLNPNDPTIADAFKLWNKAKGKVLKGLVTRRQAEADLYFTN